MPIVLVGLSLLLGCGDPSASPSSTQSSATRDAALAVLDSLKQDVFRHAFDQLPDYHYTRRVRTEQLREDGSVLAREARTLRYDGSADAPGPEVVQADSSGRFKFGFFRPFLSNAVGRHDPAALTQHIVSEEPPYLSARNHGAYRYRLLPDTTLGGRRVRIVALRARPSADDDHPIRQARLYIDRRSHQLVGVRLERRQPGLLLDEKSQLGARLQPGPDGAWLPHIVRSQTRLQLPFLSPRTFRTTSVYDSYERAT